ncbi:MAG: hypothetical protein ACOYJY_07185, partial [Acutalibacteraceae bacterium]
LLWVAPPQGSIGIIGGADFPTTSFIASVALSQIFNPFYTTLYLFLVMVAVGLALYIPAKRRLRKESLIPAEEETV